MIIKSIGLVILYLEGVQMLIEKVGGLFHSSILNANNYKQLSRLFFSVVVRLTRALQGFQDFILQAMSRCEEEYDLLVDCTDEDADGLLEPESEDAPSRSSNEDGDADSNPRRSSSFSPSPGPIILQPGQCLEKTHLRLRKMEDLFEKFRASQDTIREYRDALENYPEREVLLPDLKLEKQDATRWEMAWRSMQSHGYKSVDQTPDIENKLLSRSKDWPGIDDFDDLWKFSIAFAFSATACLYGGLHALAWNAHFHTYNEQLLWRIASCAVMGGLPSLYLVAMGFENLGDDGILNRQVHV